MKIILDTNVLISGIFFTGPPYQILKAWRDGKVNLVVSPEILEEYHRVGEDLAGKYPSVNIQSFLKLVTVNAMIVPDLSLSEPVSEDPDDDMFLACAISSKCPLVISGDQHLLKVSGFKGIRVIKPRRFLDEYLLE